MAYDKKEIYLEIGDDRTEVLLVFREGHVLKRAAPIVKACVISSEEHGHR